MPPKVKAEDNWKPAQGQPRLVRCHECSSWEEWKYVAEKGAIDGNPVPEIEGYPVLECWDCYIKRVDTNLTWGDAKKLFIKYNKRPRNDRVEQFQDLISYITFPEGEGPEAEPSKQKLKKQKIMFDELNKERMAFEASGGWVAFSRVQMSSGWPARLTIARHGQRPWPGAMASGHGQGQWPCSLAMARAMALGHGKKPWPTAMATGHGAWPWPVDMPSGHGHGHGPEP